MTETVSRPQRSSLRTRRFRAGAAIALAVVIGLVLWLALRDRGSSSSTNTNATAVNELEIRNLAASVRHPVFWLGRKPGYTYELTQTSNGTIFVRYLPPGTKVGTNKPYLTVATYPFPGALKALKVVAKKDGNSYKIAHGGLAVPASNYPQSVHVAYPGVDYQVEVYDPTAGTAEALVAAGKLDAVGGLNTGSSSEQTTSPVAATPADLKALANSLGHPIYWAGPKQGFTYELLHTSGGQVYIRYLPPGVQVGASAPYLTVATYPFPSAFGAIQALTKQQGVVSYNLANGGLAELDPKYPKSIHLAYPNSDYQIEVFDPSPARVRRIVTLGKVTSIG